MPLTDSAVKAAKPRTKPYRLFDSRGLYLEVAPSGGRWWRFKYRYAGKEKRLSLGVYPDVSLKDARDRREDARKLLDNNVDPVVQRLAERSARHTAAANTFEAIANEWFATKEAGWAKSHSEKVIGRLQNHVYPKFGHRGISTITRTDVQSLAKSIEKDSPDTAKRVLQNLGVVFRYAMNTDRAESDPAYKANEVLKNLPDDRHYPAILEPEAIGVLLRAIDGYQGAFVTRCALRLAPLVFVRPGELRHAEWQEIDFAAEEWRIPAAKMKKRFEHRVPLSKPAIAILRELQALTGKGRYLFPGRRTPARCMSENTLNAALRYLGYSQTEMVAHGFRRMASTNLHELGYASHLIEVQLAHTDTNQVRAAYNAAQYWPERKKMMADWAAYLGGLRSGAKVVPIKGLRA